MEPGQDDWHRQSVRCQITFYRMLPDQVNPWGFDSRLVPTSMVSRRWWQQGCLVGANFNVPLAMEEQVAGPSPCHLPCLGSVAVTTSHRWRLPETGGGSVETCRSDRRIWTKPPSRAGRFRHLQLVIHANAEVVAVITRHVKLGVTVAAAVTAIVSCGRACRPGRWPWRG